MKCFEQQYKLYQNDKKSEWEKTLNKVWKKLTVGQQMTIMEKAMGKKMLDFHYYPKQYVSEFDKDGKKMYNDKGQKLERTWESFEKSNLSSIFDKRQIYDYLIKNNNFPVLDRKIGTGISSMRQNK